MALDFPSSPTNGAIYTANNMSWQYDGTKWTPMPNSNAFVPISGGTMGGPLALVGVTDGSNAAAGQVGEYLSNLNTTNIANAGATWLGTAAGSITLTPGDWDVWGAVFFSGGTMTACIVGIATGTVGDPGSTPQSGKIQVSGSGLGNAYVATALTRWNVTQNTTVYVASWCSYSGSQNLQGWIAARRVR